MDSLLNVTTVLSVVLLLIVLFSVRRAHIRVEYSMTWLLASVAMLILSRSRTVLDGIRHWIGLPDSPLALFLIGASVMLVLAFRFTMILSHLRDDNVALAQRVAILEYYLREMKNEK